MLHVYFSLYVLWHVLILHQLIYFSRLKGHKGMITQCQFMRKYDCLITRSVVYQMSFLFLLHILTFCVFSSKDTFVKFWDLSTQHCFLTLTEHRNEVSL